MRREVAVLACSGLVLLGTVANIVAGPRKTVGKIGTATSPIHHPVPPHVDISGVFLRH